MEEIKKRKSNTCSPFVNKKHKPNEDGVNPSPNMSLSPKHDTFQQYLRQFQVQMQTLGITSDSAKVSYKVKLQAAEQKYIAAEKNIKDLQAHINKQVRKINELKEKLHQQQKYDSEIKKSFTETCDYQNTLFERMNDFKRHLEDIEGSVDCMTKWYGRITEKLNTITKSSDGKIYKMQQYIVKLQSEKKVLEDNAKRQTDIANSTVGELQVCEQKLSELRSKKVSLCKLMEDERNKLIMEKETLKKELQCKFEKELSQVNTKCQNLNLKIETCTMEKEKDFEKSQTIIRKLEQEVTDSRTRIDELNTKIESTNAEKSSVEFNLQKFRNHLEDVEQQKSKVNEQLRTVQEKLNEKENEVTKVCSNLLQSSHKIDETVAKIQILEETLAKKDNEIEVLIKEIEKQRDSHQSVTDRNKQLEESFSEVEKMKDKLSCDMNNEKQLMQLKDDELQELLEKVDTIESGIKEKDEEIENLNSKLVQQTKLQKEIEQMKKKVEKQTTQIKDLIAEKKQLKSESREFSDKYEVSQADVTLLEVRINEMKELLQYSTAKYEQLQNKLRENESELKDINQKKTALEISVVSSDSKTQDILKKLNAELSDLKKQKENLQSQVEKSIAADSKTKEALKKVKTELSNLKKENHKLEDKLTKNATEDSKTKKALEKAELELSDLMKENKRFVDQQEKNSEIDLQSKDEIEKLMERIASHEKTEAELKTRNTDLENLLTTNMTDSSKTREELTKIKNELREVTKKGEQLGKSLTKITSVKEKTQSTLTKVREELKNLKKEKDALTKSLQKKTECLEVLEKNLIKKKSFDKEREKQRNIFSQPTQKNRSFAKDTKVNPKEKKTIRLSQENVSANIHIDNISNLWTSEILTQKPAVLSGEKEVCPLFDTSDEEINSLNDSPMKALLSQINFEPIPGASNSNEDLENEKVVLDLLEKTIDKLNDAETIETKSNTTPALSQTKPFNESWKSVSCEDQFDLLVNEMPLSDHTSTKGSHKVYSRSSMNFRNPALETETPRNIETSQPEGTRKFFKTVHFPEPVATYFNMSKKSGRSRRK